LSSSYKGTENSPGGSNVVTILEKLIGNTIENVNMINKYFIY
jgi:hypothetical protein